MVNMGAGTVRNEFNIRRKLEEVINELIDGLLVLHEPYFKSSAWYLLRALN